MLNLNDKLSILTKEEGKFSFKQYVLNTYKHHFHVLSDTTLNEAISNYCELNGLCEKCLDKKLCTCINK